MSIQPDVVLAACPVCGNAIVKLDHVQKCVDKLKLARRGFQIMAGTIFKEMVPRDFQTVAIRDGQYERAGGDAECPVCRLPLVEHPEIPGFLTFHIVCDHRTVKL
jgi:hypothetical protein